MKEVVTGVVQSRNAFEALSTLIEDVEVEKIVLKTQP